MEVKRLFWWFIGLIWKWILKHGTEIKKLHELPPEHQALIMDAIKVREKAYTPYSKFKVGVALRVEGSNIPFLGCNIEGADYDATHAERAAIAAMISNLGGNSHPLIIVVAVVLEADGKLHAPPCGGCRQRIKEFGNDATVILGARLNPDGTVRDVECSTLGKLLPLSFGPENLGR
ncbi:MAG: cytidine deaminase [Patescibacteria group bacterium]